jgi:spore maturation protein CgeB
MRVFVVGPQFADSFAQNVVVTLQAMGHTVACSAGTRARHHGNRYLNGFWRGLYGVLPALELSDLQTLVREARKFQPELVLVSHSAVPPRVVAELKQSCSGKVACWYTDPVVSLYRQYLLGAPYDAIFLKEPFLVRVFREKLGVEAHYLPECCNPMWHRRIYLSEEEKERYGCDLAAIGSLHYYRARMLEPFGTYDLKIWGSYAPHWVETTVRGRYMNQYVACKEKAKALTAAKIVVNTMLYAEIEGVNCTLFEAAGCGAFQITESKPALGELFEPEREVVTFRTQRELREKVDHYLVRPEERREVSDQAYARARREHTYEARLRKMLGILGFAPQVCTRSASEGYRSAPGGIKDQQD